MTKIFHFHNKYHLGDNLLNLKYLLYLSNYLKKKDYIVYYYYDVSWPYNKLSTLQSYTDPTVVQLKPLHGKPSSSIELWMGIDIDGVNHRNAEVYYDKFYKNILKYFGITDFSLSTSIWVDEPFLKSVYDSLDPKYKNIDILILNSIGRSGQYNNNRTLNDLVRYLTKRFNIVVSDPVDNVTSAQDLSLQQIGAISTHAKYVISTCSGPQIPCFNRYTKEHVKKWFLVTDGDKYFFPSIDCVHIVHDLTPIRQFFDSL